MTLKKLGIVKNIVEAVGMNITHAYEDLVFLEHNAFLLQFTDNSDQLLIHWNSEADRAALQDTVTLLQGTAENHAMTFIIGSDYSISQADDENLKIEFKECTHG